MTPILADAPLIITTTLGLFDVTKILRPTAFAETIGTTGALLGRELGVLVEEGVGFGVGLKVGEGVGVAVGFGVGEGVGVAVGFGVGTAGKKEKFIEVETDW